MPSYFYHLAFELYPHPCKPEPQTPSSTEPEDVYLPPTGANIFTEELPVHRILSWASPQKKRKHIRSKTAVSSIDLQSHPATQRPSYSERRSSHLDALPPGQPNPTPATASGSPANSLGSKDWRFDRVSIQSIDMQIAPADDGARPRVPSLSAPRASNGSGLATKGRFVPSDPKNTEVGWGVVHLYRDAQETPGLYEDTSSSGGSELFQEENCTTLCILAVPSYMTPSDLLGYVGEQTREDVSHFRLIRTGRANKYMVLMKFREAKKAKAWRHDWNGKLFNSMEPENCHVVFVKSIEFQTADAHRDPSSFPNMNNDPFTPTARPSPTAPTPASAAESASLTTSLTAKPLAPPTPALVELPTCPVCLERMDETTGLLTILCQHVFHCACLEKWRGSGCPVCRYTQSDSLLARGYASDGDAPENECSVCGTTSNLWICLICGSTGCGRYDSAHAFQHYESTSHSYAMDIATQHVWDYAGDGYVHRLIQNKADGKLVDLPAAHQTPSHPNASMTGLGADTVPREKLDNMGAEYAYLLTSQLESQRCYFEEQVERAVDKAAKASQAAEDAAATATALATRLEKVQMQYLDAQTQINSLEKDMARHAARSAKSDELARRLGKQYQEEKSVSGALMERIKHLDERIKGVEEKNRVLEAEKKELEEQNRDLGFFISGGQKLKELGGEIGEEVTEGRVEVPMPAEEGKGKKRKGKGKK
ncbi:zf-UBP-domain-containing protein [Saccharata proteae CBS 121410]|uniref:Zf-UBP-domain-containing protein n=1 Tax=Saccharata proteae CBS 121410 TaxID=1314787 RepID=A0A6A5YDN7_9PEZI|nr:zf-UBP-domain-containing protein [Saccharata proteae CBS 121410]